MKQINFTLGSVHSVCRRGGGVWRGGVWRVLQIFQKTFCSPGDHRPKYLIVQ